MSCSNGFVKMERQFQHYLTLLQVKTEGGSQPIPIRPATATSMVTEQQELSNVSQQQQGGGNFEPFRSLLEPNGMRPRKPCNCTKSQCLKLYCDCFANGEFCHLCNCTSCFNNLTHEEDRQKVRFENYCSDTSVECKTVIC